MTAEGSRKRDVCAVVVTYYPDADFPDRAARIARQVDRMVVIDNGSGDPVVSTLRELAPRLNNHLILNDENVGLATALNQGMHWAKERGYRWALTFDQDTVPADFMVSTLLGIYGQFDPEDKVALVGSNYQDKNSQRLMFPTKPSDAPPWSEQQSVITSGSLILVAAFDVVGPFRDDFFIDFVDHEYCLRLRSHGYKVLVSREPLMVHSLGNQTQHKLLWKHLVCTNHSPSRRYYVARNRLFLTIKYAREEPRWALKNVRDLFKEAICVIAFEDRRAQKVVAVLLGSWHALSGRMGKLVNRVWAG